MFFNSLLADDTTWYPITFDSPLNIARGICFWMTIALVLGILLGVLMTRGQTRKAFLKIALIAVIGFACAVCIVLLVFSFLEDGIVAILFAPLLTLIVVVGGCAILIALRRSKLTLILSGCLIGAALIATLVCMGIHFGTGDAADLNDTVNEDVNTLGLYISAVLAVAAVVAAALFFGRHDKKGFDSASIAYASMCIAMSFALSYLRIVQMPQGGSITIASLVPLMIYSYMFGIRKGVIAGFIYGLMQAFQDPYILHPAQFLLDYPVAFSCIGLAGIFAKTKALEKVAPVQFGLGAIVAGLGRFVMHFLSGMFAFGMWAPEGQPVWLYSLIYQSGYVLPDIAIAIVVGVLLFSSPAFVRQVRKYNTVKPAPAAEAVETPGEEQAQK